MSIIPVDTTHHLLSLPPYTEPLKHYSAPVSQPVSILFVINVYILSYASPLVWKLHPHGEVTSKTYKPTFLTTHLMVVLQLSGYSVFHGGDTPIQLGLP